MEPSAVAPRARADLTISKKSLRKKGGGQARREDGLRTADEERGDTRSCLPCRNNNV